MDNCKNCGAPLVEDARCCGFCGTPVGAVPPPQIPVYQQPQPFPQQPQPFPQQPQPFPQQPQPFSQQPQPFPQQTAQEPPKKKRKRSALTVLLSVLLCILMVVSLVPAFLLGTVSGALDEDTYLQILLDVDLSRLSGSLLDEDLSHMDLAEAICHQVNGIGQQISGPAYWKDLTPDDLEVLLKETQLPEFAAEQLDRLTKAILSGKKSVKIRTKDVLDLLEDDLEVLVEDMDLPIDPDALEEAAEEILRAVGAEEIPLEFDRETEQILDYVRKALSAETLTVLLAAVGVLILLLMLVDLRFPFHGLRDVGIVGIVGGCLCLAVTFLPAALSGLGDMGYLASVILEGILGGGRLTAGLLVLGGTVLTVTGAVLIKLLKKKR